jgi:hypothetical protein
MYGILLLQKKIKRRPKVQSWYRKWTLQIISKITRLNERLVKEMNNNSQDVFFLQFVLRLVKE